jgi:ribosomal protein S12 methylthiotransferase accessory factor
MTENELTISFPGGLQVSAEYRSQVIPTDQAPPHGDGSAPTPFALFLASIGTCAGIYVLNFCRQRDIPTEKVRLIQRLEYDQNSRLIGRIELEIQVPPDFPEKYHPALIRAADHCAVKRHLENPPKVETYTEIIS